MLGLAGVQPAADPGVSVFMSETVKITVRPNGPLQVEGSIVLSDANGKVWDLPG